jgi:hypothetical protein
MARRFIPAILLFSLGAFGYSALPTPIRLADSAAKKTAPQTQPARKADTSADSFDCRSGTIVGAGIGLSLGSMPEFDIWNGNLAQQLSDLGLSDTSFLVHGLDTGLLAFTVRQSPDLFSMTFPITVYVGELYPRHRLTGSLTFAYLTKEYDARIALVNDSARYFDLQQTLGLYSFTAGLTWGSRIPERYFSVDGIDRTDALIGILATPYLALQRSSTVGAPPTTDVRLTELYQAILPQVSSFSALGIAYGWRMALATIKHSSKRSGLEAELAYSGMWNTRFRTSSGATIVQADLGEKGSSAGSALSYYTSRIEISISLFRKVSSEKPRKDKP